MKEVELLVSRGHALKDVLEVYTMPQVFAFVKAANESMEDEFMTLATSTRIAMAKDKEWRNFIESRKYRDARRKGKVIGAKQAESLKSFLGGGKSGGADRPRNSGPEVRRADGPD